MTSRRHSASGNRQPRLVRGGAAALFAAGFFFAGLLPGGAPSTSAQTAAPQTASGTAPVPKKNKAAQAQGASVQPKPRTAAHKRETKGFVDTIMEGPRITTTPPESADWVRQTRPAPEARRQSAGPAVPSRPLLSADEIKAREAALENARARHDKIAGRKPPTGKFGSAAGKPEVPAEEKPKAGCIMTCSTPIGVPRSQRR